MTPAQIQSYKVLSYAIMGAPIVIGILMPFLLSSVAREPGGPNPFILVGLFAAALMAHGACNYTYSFVKPMRSDYDASLDDRGEMLEAIQPNLMIRIFICMALVVPSISLSLIAASGGLTVYITGAVLGFILMAIHVYPSGESLRKIEARLTADGARAPLVKLFEESKVGGAAPNTPSS